jgi:signal transduction histidine kinase
MRTVKAKGPSQSLGGLPGPNLGEQQGSPRDDGASIEAGSRLGSPSDDDRGSAQRGQLLDSLRDEFLAIAAHELRTPTTTLRLLLQSMEHLLSEPTLTPATVERLRRTLAKSVEQCDRLVQFGERVLDASQLQSGTFSLRTLEIDCSTRAALSS